MSFQDQSLILTVQKVLEYFKQIDLPSKVDLVTGVRSETALFDVHVIQCDLQGRRGIQDPGGYRTSGRRREQQGKV